MGRNRFTLYRVDHECTMFLVIRKGTKELPVVTYGIFNISEGSQIYCNRKLISEELTESGELEALEKEAKEQYIKMKKKIRVARR